MHTLTVNRRIKERNPPIGKLALYHLIQYFYRHVFTTPFIRCLFCREKYINLVSFDCASRITGDCISVAFHIYLSSEFNDTWVNSNDFDIRVTFRLIPVFVTPEHPLQLAVNALAETVNSLTTLSIGSRLVFSQLI